MKRKTKKQTIKKKKEFRYHNIVTFNKRGKKIKIRHPTYVFLEKGNIYVYVSITHSSESDMLPPLNLEVGASCSKNPLIPA